ncbi:hypothetical protein D3C73_1648960 [compost metagenome]
MMSTAWIILSILLNLPPRPQLLRVKLLRLDRRLLPGRLPLLILRLLPGRLPLLPKLLLPLLTAR